MPNEIQINGLPAANSFGGSDVIAIETGGVTYKLTGATLAAALETIGNYAQKNNSSANALINALPLGDSTPASDDYFISQYVNGGTSNTNYYRRKISTIWDYIKSMASNVDGVSVRDNTYIKSVDGGAIKIGKAVIFTVEFKPKTNISQSVTGGIQGLPGSLYNVKFLVSTPDAGVDATRMALVDNNGYINIYGSYTADTSYRITGAYIAANA